MTDFASPPSAPRTDKRPDFSLTPFARVALALARICLGWIFLWAFLDKLFGLGYATPSQASWLNGGSPTAGYLAGVQGTFAELFAAMSGHTWADWLYMFGMGGLGVSLVLGIGMRIASLGGIALLGMLWLSALPLDNNPVVDEHLVYLVTAIALAAARAGDTLGFGRAWANSGLVRVFPFLR